MQLVVKDTFIGANGTTLANHAAVPGGNWAAPDAGWELLGNAAVPTANVPQNAYFQLPGRVASLQVSTQCGNLAADDEVRIGFDANPFMSLMFLFQAGGELSLQVQSDPAAPTYPLGNGLGNHTLDLTFGPGRVDARVDGIPALTIPRPISPADRFFTGAMYAVGTGANAPDFTVGDITIFTAAANS